MNHTLAQDNFHINMITINDKRQINTTCIDDRVVGFTNSNSAQILGFDNTKYKVMFKDLEISQDTTFVTFQISFMVDDKYYNPYLFHPIKNDNTATTSDGPGRAITYRMFESKFDFVWMYFTLSGVQQILRDFTPEDTIVSDEEYLKEFFTNLYL